MSDKHEVEERIRELRDELIRLEDQLKENSQSV